MPGFTRAATTGGDVTVSGGNLTLVLVVLLIGVVALGMAAVFRSQVLAADEGTENMKTIAKAVQE